MQVNETFKKLKMQMRGNSVINIYHLFSLITFIDCLIQSFQ